MIEDHALIFMLLAMGIPWLIGASWAFLTRPRKIYYKWVGSKYRKFKY